MITSRDLLVQTCCELQQQQKRIVFTNGCFDILHRGHVTYLAAARNLGDVLILGLNADVSVQRLKGPSRPINPQEDRAAVVDALSSVNYVTFFDDDTPLELIRAVQPDVLVKGGDYEIANIVGADIVQARGGTVCTIPFVDGKSTSNIIRAINVQRNAD